MNITVPSGKTGSRAPLVAALVAALAVAGAGLVASSDFGDKQSAPRAIQAGQVEPGRFERAMTLTFVLVASEEQADYLRYLRAESGAYVDPKMQADQVVILSVGTPEEELRALEMIRVSSEAAGMVEFPQAVSVVDARATDFTPR